MVPWNEPDVKPVTRFSRHRNRSADGGHRDAVKSLPVSVIQLFST